MKRALKAMFAKFVLWLSKSYSVYLLISAIVFVLLIIAVISDRLGFTQIFELSVFSAVLLESTLIALSELLCKRLANRIEDPSKLCRDTEKLVKMYKSSADKMLIGDDNKLIPVIFDGWVFDRIISISDSPDNEYSLPDLAIKNYEKLFSAHMTSNIYNNINVRVSDWYIDTDTFVVSTSRTTYYNSLVTNRAMDFEIEKGLSIRQLYECGPIIHPLKSSCLSNHLGFNGFLESRDNYFAFIFRQGSISIGKRTWGNSVGASLKAKYALSDSQFTVNGLENGILSEFEDELRIKRHQLVSFGSQMDKAVVISAYRDLVEGGKPQLLVYTKSEFPKDKITELFKAGNKDSKKEAKKIDGGKEKSEVEMSADGKKIYWISREDILNSIKIMPDKIVHNGKTLPMMPSAAACVVMLREFLRKQNETSA